jgi:hypothetical protein
MYNPFMNIYIYGNMLDKLLQTQNYHDPEMSSNLHKFFISQKWSFGTFWMDVDEF